MDLEKRALCLENEFLVDVPRAHRVRGRRRQKVFFFDPRAQQFLWLVANFSGSFYRSQANRFFESGGGTPVQKMLDTLTHPYGLARAVVEGKKGRLRYHLFGKQVYRRIGEPDSAFRQERVSPTITHARIAALDWVIDHIDDEFIPGVEGKVWCFEHEGVPGEFLPRRRIGNPHKSGGVVVHFPDKSPISYRYPDGMQFTYVDVPGLSIRDFDTHLARYAPLLRAYPSEWALTIIATDPFKLTGYAELFSRWFVNEPENNAPDPKLVRYFELTKASNDRRLAAIGQAGIVERDRLGKIYDTPANKKLYAEWLAGKPLPNKWTKPAAPFSLRFYYAPSFCRIRKSNWCCTGTSFLITDANKHRHQELTTESGPETDPERREGGWERPPVPRSLRDSGSLPSPQFLDIRTRTHRPLHFKLEAKAHEMLEQWLLNFRESADDFIEKSLRRLFEDDKEFAPWVEANAHLHVPRKRRRSKKKSDQPRRALSDGATNCRRESPRRVFAEFRLPERNLDPTSSVSKRRCSGSTAAMRKHRAIVRPTRKRDVRDVTAHLSPEFHEMLRLYSIYSGGTTDEIIATSLQRVFDQRTAIEPWFIPRKGQE